MATTVPLDQVAQRIARQAAELEALRRDYEARKRQLADLTRRKQQLQSQLDKVETDILALTGGSTPAPAVKPRPAVAKGKSKSKSGVSLPEMLQQVLRDLGCPLTHRQLVEEMVAAEIPDEIERSAEASHDPRRRDGQEGPPAPHQGWRGDAARGRRQRSEDSCQARLDGQGLSRRSSPNPAREQPPLRAVLTTLLEKSKGPMPGGELARLAKATGYQSTSTDFEPLHVTLNKMNNIERVKGQGYRLKKR